MHVSNIPIDELKPFVKNPKKHPEKQLKFLQKSFREFGWTNPILVAQDNMIVAGHGRWEAAKQAGFSEVPVIKLDMPYEKAVAYVVADNHLAELAETDTEQLAELLQEISQIEDFDIEATGFDMQDIDEMLEELHPREIVEDEVPDIPEEPITVRGDVWELGRHRLVCGDSTSKYDVEILMDGKMADICFTSPPYNAGSLNVRGQRVTSKKYNNYDDNKTSDDYTIFLKNNISCMLPFCTEIFYNIGLVQNNKKEIFRLIYHFENIFKDIIYWKKTTAAPHIQPGVINNLVEFIICFGDGKRSFKNAQFSQGTYWNVIEGNGAGNNEYSEIHKATFPIYLPINIITNFTNETGAVVDCFGGTGTTLIACEQTNRINYSMEIDPHYCDVIIQRYVNLTGNTELKRNGEPYTWQSKEP